MFDIDTGGSAKGPFINWKAQRRAFELRVSKDEKREIDNFSRGVVLDLEKIKIGWQHSEFVMGKAPTWKWWPSPNQRIEKPTDDWKWGMSLPIALGGKETAVWEQAGAAVQTAIQELLPALSGGPEGKLPLVRYTEAKERKFNVGSTTYPVFEVVQWVDRPECLKEGSMGAIDTGDAPAPATTAPPPAPPAPAGAEAFAFD